MEPKETDCYEPVCENDDPLLSMKRLVNKSGKRYQRCSLCGRLGDFGDDDD